MTRTKKSKKILITAVITSALAFGGLQIAGAAPGGPGPGMGYPCQMQGQGPGAAVKLDPEMVKKQTTFMNETKELRKAMSEKRAAMRALMKSNNPDPALASKIAGELFNLREELRSKAVAAGLPQQMFSMGCMGMNQMFDGPMSSGRHHGRRF